MDDIPWVGIITFLAGCASLSYGLAGLVLWAINRHNRRHRY